MMEDSSEQWCDIRPTKYMYFNHCLCVICGFIMSKSPALWRRPEANGMI